MLVCVSVLKIFCCRQAKFFIYIVIGTHWTACFFFLLATVTKDLGTRGRVLDDSSVWINRGGLALGNSDNYCRLKPVLDPQRLNSVT